MINWENINYIFQIPLSWYKKIHDKVFNAYGENFIRVKQDGENGGIKIGIDEDNFSQAVLEIAGGGSGGGTVKSVDGIPPDAGGNVPLDAVKSVNDNFPDANGNVTVRFPQGAVDSVDHISPDQFGNVQLNAIRTINGHNGDSVGNFAGVVMKVNNTTPDENGNVTIERGVTSVNNVPADQQGNVPLDLGVLTINDEPPDPNGNIDISLNFVKTINGEPPDPSGNIEVDELEAVKTVNNIEPDPNGNVNVGTVRSVNNKNPDSSGNVKLSIVEAIDGVPPGPDGNVDLGAIISVNELYSADANGNVDIPIAEKVDGHSPDSNGEVTFGLASDKWLKSDALGHIVATNETPIIPSSTDTGYVYSNNGTVSYTSLSSSKWVKSDSNGLLTTTDDEPIIADSGLKGFIYNNNGTIQYKDEEYVTIATDQIVKGVKTFGVASSNDRTCISLLANNHISAMGGVQGCSANFAGDYIDLTRTISGGSNVQGVTIDCILYPRIQFSSTFGEDTRHFGRVNRVYGDTTYPEGLYVTDSDLITLTVPANKAVLENQPTETTTTSKAIATVGYCQSKFGKVKTVNGISPDPNGNVAINNDTYTKAQIDTKLEGYVTLNTEQSITGRKLFGADKLLVKTTGNTGDPSSYGYFRMATLDGNVKGYVVSGSSNGANSLTAVRAIAGNVYTGVNVATDGVTHQQTLENEPESDTTSKTSHQIASRGWTNKYFWRKNDNATGVLYAENGTLSYKTNFVQEDDLEDYALANDVYTKTEVDNKLTSYALASNVYTKTEVDNKLGSYVTTNTDQDIIATKRMKDNKNFLFYSNWEYDSGTHYNNAFEFFTKSGKRLARLIFGQQSATHNQVWLRSYGSDSQYSGVQMDVIMNGTEPEYRQLLDNEPARLYSTGQDNQIASRGYCRLNFARINHTHGDLYVTLEGDQVVNGQKTFSGQTTVAGLNVGSIQRAVQAMGNILIVGNANTTNNILFYPNNSMIRGTALPDNPSDQEIATVGWVKQNGGKVKTVNYEEPDPDGNIQLDMVTSVDGHGPNEDGAVSFNLAGNKFVKTDSNGHLTTSDTGGETVTKKVITNVTWNSSTNQFDISSENWEFEDGLLKSITTNAQTHIATVTYTGT